MSNQNQDHQVSKYQTQTLSLTKQRKRIGRWVVRLGICHLYFVKIKMFHSGHKAVLSYLHYFADNGGYYGHSHSLCFLKCHKVSGPFNLQSFISQVSR